MKIYNDIYLVGADEHRQHLFENIHPLENGVSYNAYLLLDEKTVLFDTVDWSVCRDFLENISKTLNGRTLDYLVVHHMEPDHCACIEEIIIRYPDVTIITTQKSSVFMEQFGFDVQGRLDIVGEKAERNFGKHTLTFMLAPLVHWPEVMVSFDAESGILFSADAFGTFGALNGKVFFDEYENKPQMLDEYRRYYSNIVGKYGQQVQGLLKKVGTLDIKMICPLHGPIIRTDLPLFIEKYNLWSTYMPEKKGALVVYSSMYGNTEKAVKTFAKMLQENNIENEVFDVSTTNLSKLIAKSFEYSHIVIGAVTYNAGLFPRIHSYIEDLKALNVQNKTVGIIENGTWATTSGKQIREFMQSLKNTTVLENVVSIKSSVKAQNYDEMQLLMAEIKGNL